MKEQSIMSHPLVSSDRLKEAVDQARQAQAEQGDIITDLRSAELARLQLLLNELEDIKEDATEDRGFTFSISEGTPPRLWIDVLSFVVMGRDKRTYRFIKDVRSGRKVIMETGDVKQMANSIIDYVAHAFIEREKALAETNEDSLIGKAKTVEETQPVKKQGFNGFDAIQLFIFGIMVGAAVVWAYLTTAPQ